MASSSGRRAAEALSNVVWWLQKVKLDSIGGIMPESDRAACWAALQKSLALLFRAAANAKRRRRRSRRLKNAVWSFSASR